MQQILTPEQIRKICNPDVFKQASKPDSAGDKVIIGQDRAIKALQLGLGMKVEGFNIYVAGDAGTGKLTAVTSFVGSQAKSEPSPFDWCYVNNFRDIYMPEKLCLPAGSAVKFRKDVKNQVLNIYHALVKAFESEDFSIRKEKLISDFETEQANILGGVAEQAEKESFMVKQTKTSIITIPLKDNKPLGEKELKAMSEAEIDEINRKQDALQQELSTALREIRKYEKATDESIDKLEKEVAQFAIGSLVNELIEKYKAIPQVTKYLNSVQEDIMDNLPEFMKSQKASAASIDRNPFIRRYEVAVVVDNSETQGAPVIIERNPTYNNLLGRVEKESFMGTLVTDFTMIRKGALHSANGGYLVVRVEELLQNDFAWDCLKRAIRNKEIAIEEAMDQLGYLTSRSLKPEPIPLDVKVILIGSSFLYHALYEHDSDYRELFKIKAEFDNLMERTEDNVRDYAAFVQHLCRNENVLPVDNTAIARIIEYSSRLAEDQDKLSTHFVDISDILREADFYAKKEQVAYITGPHVAKAIGEKMYRSNLIQGKINELIRTEQIFIDVKDSKVGQINGLSVLSTGDISFGIPTRITCSVGLGKEGVIAVEREAEMSGPIHTKGVLILTGYLVAKFMQDKPTSLSARLVFEQSYSEVEGDSASSTELYAILSAVSGLPIKQGIAVTGSVNQKGEIQPIGGINEKIEGYYEICQQMGLTGEQGVLVPSANTRNLMLKEDVVNAVRQGKFRIWAVDTIEDGIEILTGVTAGSIWEEDTVFGRVNSALEIYAGRMKQFGDEKEEELIGYK